MKTKNEMPDIILDLTNENLSIEEAIAECEAKRQQILPWYKKVAKRIKAWF